MKKADQIIASRLSLASLASVLNGNRYLLVHW